MSDVTYFEVVRGEDRVFNIQLMNEETGLYYDLTSATGIAVKFKNADLSTLTKNLSGGVSVVSAVAGKIQVTLTDAETALLALGVQPFYVEVDISTSKRIIVSGFERALKIIDKPF